MLSTGLHFASESTRQFHLPIYGLEVSPDLISTVTDAVLETVAEWQNRPLEPMFPLVFFDALPVKIRDEGSFATRPSMSR
jgi:transposase-like protein